MVFALSLLLFDYGRLPLVFLRGFKVLQDCCGHSCFKKIEVCFSLWKAQALLVLTLYEFPSCFTFRLQVMVNWGKRIHTESGANPNKPKRKHAPSFTRGTSRKSLFSTADRTPSQEVGRYLSLGNYLIGNSSMSVFNYSGNSTKISFNPYKIEEDLAVTQAVKFKKETKDCLAKNRGFHLGPVCGLT